jgi:3-dehydroquinate dehydratase-1
MIEFEAFVLAAATADLADAYTDAARAHADAVEFRMDFADEPLAALEEYDGPLPVIATNRADWEGGEAEPEGRLAALETAAEHPSVGAVDLELQALANDPAAQATLDHAHAHDAAVIVSVHDFEGTPPAEELAELLASAAAAGDVGKLAVTAESLDDALRLLSVTHAMSGEGARVATMAMGAAGRHTRAVAPVYGSRIGYAPVDPAEATAPGQFDLATLATLVDRLR